MQTFIDTATQQVYGFEADVSAIKTAAGYVFKTVDGEALNVPATLQPYTAPAPTAAQQLSDAQAAQVNSIYDSYAQAIAQNVAYTSKGGVAQTYQADDTSMKYVNRMLAAYQASQTTPSGFYWVAADNTQVPFAFADLEGLAAAMGNQGWAAFQKLQTYKAQIRAATTIAAVQSVTWS